MRKNHYQIIGLPNDAPIEAIRAAHQAKRQQFAAHPEAIRLIDAAAATLSDPEHRKAYDLGLRATRLHANLPATDRSATGRRSGAPWFIGGLLAAGALGWHYAGPLADVPTAPVVRPSLRAPVAAPISAQTEDDDVATLAPLAPPPTPALDDRPAGLAERVRPPKRGSFDPRYLAWSVYRIVGAKSRGSGVMLERDKIITNCHVIAGSYKDRSIVAINSVTGDALYPEKIAILSDSEDVCMLHVPGSPDYVAEWGSTSKLETGSRTFTVSFPGNEGLSWSPGNLLARKNIRGLNVLLTSNYCRPGVSGGALFDSEGRVIGITSAGMIYNREGQRVAGECISIEADTAKDVMTRTLMSIAITPLKYDGVWSTQH